MENVRNFNQDLNSQRLNVHTYMLAKFFNCAENQIINKADDAVKYCDLFAPDGYIIECKTENYRSDNHLCEFASNINGYTPDYLRGITRLNPDHFLYEKTYEYMLKVKKTDKHKSILTSKITNEKHLFATYYHGDNKYYIYSIPYLIQQYKILFREKKVDIVIGRSRGNYGIWHAVNLLTAQKNLKPLFVGTYNK